MPSGPLGTSSLSRIFSYEGENERERVRKRERVSVRDIVCA